MLRGRELSAVGVADSASHPGPAMLWPFAPNAPIEVAELVAPLMMVPLPREPLLPGMIRNPGDRRVRLG
jgi:hypothetical protein